MNYNMQIYGIDLASEKFDVSFVDANGEERHLVVKNTISQIEKFLYKLPENAHLVAEHTGVYGDLLLYLADNKGVTISFVSGYEVKHSMGLVRGKSDPLDCARIRKYGEHNREKLIDSHLPSETLYKLQQLYATRRVLVDMRKLLITTQKGDKKDLFILNLQKM